MKSRKFIILLIIVILLCISSIVNAATGDSYKIDLTSSNTSLKSGETITISLEVKNINIQSGEKGLGAYEGTIVYDDNVFEELKMTGNDSWDTPIENEGIFTSVKSDGVCTSEAQEIAKITLKVKENASVGSTKIQIKNFEASNGEENIPTEDAELTVNIIEEVQDNNNVVDNNSTDEGTDTNTNTNTNTNTIVTNNSTNVNVNKTQNKLPHTGLSETMGIIITIVVIIGIYNYVRYKRSY